jgi:protein-L-isoaspartate(D-aspartate) O-methyltransferase
MDSITEYRRFYAELVVRSAGCPSDRLVEAFASVRREDFVGPGPWQVFVGSGYIRTISNDPRLLYQDVLIGLAPDRKINNGQPSLHARCLAAVNPSPGESVVHLGAGTGYYTAILAELVGANGSVLAVEREPDLAERASASLHSLKQVAVVVASATEIVCPPCDIIYVNAGATHPLPNWLDQLRIGGRLIFPLTADDGVGVMLLVTRLANAVYAAAAVTRAAFIPCIGARDDETSATLTGALERQSLKEVRSLHRTTLPDASAWCVGKGWWLSNRAPQLA